MAMIYQQSAVERYIEKEVDRQGYGRGSPDWIIRVQWMHEGWGLALRLDAIGESPRPHHVLTLGWLVERGPDQNAVGWRTAPARAGRYAAPDPVFVPGLVEQWLDRAGFGAKASNRIGSKGRLDTALRAYREFEDIHPFDDGNGRVGKILLNWHNGTLREPVFPPADFWGKAIRNP